MGTLFLTNHPEIDRADRFREARDKVKLIPKGRLVLSMMEK